MLLAADGPQYRSQETTPEGEVIIHYGTLNKLVVHLTAADNSGAQCPDSPMRF